MFLLNTENVFFVTIQCSLYIKVIHYRIIFIFFIVYLLHFNRENVNMDLFKMKKIFIENNIFLSFLDNIGAALHRMLI